MKGSVRRDLGGLFLISLAVRVAVAALIHEPAYMDTAYYAAGAVRLAQGGGLSEPFLWNYLDRPGGLPHPGFLYWMPLPSLLAAPFAALFPGSFFALQLPFAVLSALLPLLAYTLAREASGVRRAAWTAGLLTLFSGFFFPYWTLPETFAPFALFGGVGLWLAARGTKEKGPLAPCLVYLASGVLVGLAHLTRADGILLLPVVILPSLIPLPPYTTHRPTRSSVVHCSLLTLGYLLPMAPWFLRNLSLIGAPLSPMGTRTLWLTGYDDLFCYHCDLSPSSYLAWGLPNILHSKLWAARVNLERFLAEDCLIFLFPFVILGLVRLRRQAPFTLSLICLLLIYLAHSLAFTFPGPRGGFFHAAAATLPFIFTAAAEGLETAVGWAGRRRGWNLRQALTVFTTAAVVGAVALSGYATAGKQSEWGVADSAYLEVGQWLAEHAPPQATVMVGNPPAFWYHTGHPAVAVPNEGPETLLEVAYRYQVQYVVLDRNRPAPLAGLYEGRQADPRLRDLRVFREGTDHVVLYQVER